MDFSAYTKKDIKDILNELETSENGLSEKEAEKRLKKFGYNEISTKKKTFLNVLGRQFKSPFFYLLLIAGIIAFILKEQINTIAILVFIIINTSLGFFQEYKAEKSIALLKKYLPSNIIVIRSGKEKMIDKRFLVPGDIVVSNYGDIVPADIRLITAENLLVDESILTGESSPVLKQTGSIQKESKEIFEAKNILFAGTSIVSGKAKGVVICTEKNTALGGIAKLVSGINRESVYEKDILKFSKNIMKVVIVTIVLIFILNFIIKGGENILSFSIFSIALIVSIIPEVLPLIVISALSSGALKLAKEKVVAKRLSAIEDLGNIEILCTDKTGTLTEGKMTLDNISSGDKDKCLFYGLLSSSYIKGDKDLFLNSFDTVLYHNTNEQIKNKLKNYQLIQEMPFDGIKMRNSALVKGTDNELILIAKGAPEAILKISLSTDNGKNKQEIMDEIKNEGINGKRVLAIAYKKFAKEIFTQNDENNLIYLGYFSFKDPLKKTAKESMILAKKLGVKIKILTGDSLEVAGAIAKEMKLINNPNDVISGDEINSLSGDKLFDIIERYSVFARLSPLTKYKIIEKLQEKYEVGFLGDGINDTPSLKIAHLGMVVDNASDISREVADIILLKKDLKVIVDGIREGRTIFSNINKYIKCAMASNFGNFYSIALISLFIPFLPMLPIQILLGNILSDFPLMAISTDKVDIEELKKPKHSTINKGLFLIILLALISSIFDVIFFIIFHKIDIDQIRTLWFIESILTEIVLIFSIRTRHLFLKTKRPSFLLIGLTIIDAIIIVSLAFTGFGQKFFNFSTPKFSYLLIIGGLIVSYFIISEITKLIYFRFKNYNA